MTVDFSRFPPASPLGKALRAPLKLIPPSATLPILQGRTRGMRWIVGAGNHGCWLGSYEQAQRLVFETMVGSGQIVFDIGAHSGWYSLLASRLVGPRGQVHAFEPVPDNLANLRRHLEINRIANVSVHALAITERGGQARLKTGPTSMTGHLSEDGGIEVRTSALDELLASGSAPAPDVVKMDIEGGELAALKGASVLLSAVRPIIFLSTHQSVVHDACVTLLLEHGYSVSGLEGGEPSAWGECLAEPSDVDGG